MMNCDGDCETVSIHLRPIMIMIVTNKWLATMQYASDDLAQYSRYWM